MSKSTKPDPIAEPIAHAGNTPVWCAHNDIVDLATLVPNPGNPNTHNERQLDALGRIITAQGWRHPITVSLRSGFIVAGHGRREAALRAGLTHAPIDYQHFVTEADEWAHLVADNRIAELSAIDGNLLRDALAGIDIDAMEIGYTQEELDELFRNLDLPTDIDLGDGFDKLKDGEPDFVKMSFTIPAEAKPIVDEALATAQSVMGDVDGNVNGHALVAICQHHLTGI